MPLAIGAFFGALAGLAEILFAVYLVAVEHAMVHAHPWFPFFAVVGNIAIFVVLATLASLAGSRRLTTGVVVTLFMISVLQTRPLPLHLIATVVLAAGIGYRLSRMRVSPRVAAGTATVILFASAQLSFLASQRHVPPSTDGSGFNVLLIVLDTVRARSLGIYGVEREVSPAIDSLSNHGLVFERAIAPAPWTLPTHASLFTGLYPEELDVGRRTALSDSAPRLAEVLASHGYQTGGFVANLHWTSRWTRLDRGFHIYRDYRPNLGALLYSTSFGRLYSRSPLRDWWGPADLLDRKSADAVVDEWTDWLDDIDGPFFAFLNLFEAHEPYLPADSINHLGATGPRRIEHRGNLNFPDVAFHPQKTALMGDQLEIALNAYEASIWEADAGIARAMGELRARGLLDSTIVVITSDHGESVGEYGTVGHATSLYPTETHVPLVVVGPGVAVGRDPSTVSLVDVPATIFGLLGLDHPLGGVDLLNGERSPATMRLQYGYDTNPQYPISRGDMNGLVTDSFYRIQNGDGQVEVYDVSETLYAIPEQAGPPR